MALDSPLPLPQANPAGPQGPPQPGAAPPMDIASIIQQASQTPAYQGASSRLEDIAGRERGVEAQQAALQPPKMGPGIDKGAGVLHNLGQALLMMANMTRPGQAVNQGIYGPNIHKYEAQRGALAGQLAALKDEEAVPTEELHGLTGLAQAGGNAAYRQGMLGIGQEKVDVSKQRADTAAKAATAKISTDLQRLAQGSRNLDRKDQELKLKDWFDRAVIEVSQQRVAAGQDENSARIQAQEDVKSAASQNQWAMQHPFLNAMGVSPDIQAAPGAQPTKSATPKAATGGMPAAPKEDGHTLMKDGKAVAVSKGGNWVSKAKQ